MKTRLTTSLTALLQFSLVMSLTLSWTSSSYAQDESESAEKLVCKSEYLWSVCLDLDTKVQELKQENKKLETERDNADGKAFQAETDLDMTLDKVATANQEVGELKAEKAALQQELDSRWSPWAVAGLGAAAVVVLEVAAFFVFKAVTKE